MSACSPEFRRGDTPVAHELCNKPEARMEAEGSSGGSLMSCMTASDKAQLFLGLASSATVPERPIATSLSTPSDVLGRQSLNGSQTQMMLLLELRKF